jgi:Trk K+ transport system NAD-binding subunit
VFFENSLFETLLHKCYIRNNVSFKTFHMNGSFYSILLISGLLLGSFSSPPESYKEEFLDDITNVTLTFTPVAGGDAITATAEDPDGSGPLGLAVVDEIQLTESTEYTLSILVENQTAGTNLSDEIEQNSDDYQFFFDWDEELMADPDGDGNIDDSDDPVNYNDEDNNMLPVGLSTSWTTGCGEENFSGDFRIVLKHQPGQKTDTTGVTTGVTDFDLTWTLNVQEDPEAPPCENEEEIITDVTLTFTPTEGGDPVVATASDPDGEGPLDLMINGPIDLLESTDYDLSIKVENKLEGEDITEEIMEEDDEHMFFFSWTDEVFTSPAGDGNIDNRDDPVNYNDFDENSLPVGLSTSWTTECVEENVSGKFRLVLKHQPDIKSATSTAEDGGTDLDLEWDINVEQDPEAPPCENEEEIITDVTLTFTPTEGGDPVVATASDPDGEGPLDLVINGPIDLRESTDYTMTIKVENTIEGEDITEEIMEEDDEHMFFFSWTDAVFTSPAGDGNIDNRDDPVNYNDFDENSLPVGLSTSWTTECVEENVSGKFRLVLKHQPDIKSATSTAEDGGTDLDLEWDINVAQDPEAPPCENEEEIITDVTLTFTPTEGGDPVVATASDPDGEGPLDLVINGPIDLLESTDYDLSIKVENKIEGEDITEEIMEEDDEHMFFFSWTDAVFASPAGDGNIDNREDPVNYNDFDENSLPVGLSTSWTTECGEENVSGKFRLVLKHQPDIKSATSTVADGGTDLDLEWDINVLEDPTAPPCENEEEIITDVTLTFTPEGGGNPIVATASDPDGEGPLDLVIDGPINLLDNVQYDMAIKVENTIEGEDITEEIMEEDDEHMFFFSWTDGLFSAPTGDGNIDNREDPVGYLDFDEDNLPVGLSTQWTAGEPGQSGKFRVVLKHQPDIKSATSTVEDGGTDLDLEWDLNIIMSTSVTEQQQRNASLLLYPNPTSGELWWKIQEVGLSEVQVRIYDQTGRVMKVFNADTNRIDVSDLSKGLFTLQIVSDGKIWNKRFLKQ